MHPLDEDEQILHGTFAALVREGIDSLIDRLKERDYETRHHSNDDQEWLDVGVDLYDQLTAGQQMTMLQWVANHLLVDPTLTTRRAAIQDATIVAVFEMIRNNLQIELEIENGMIADESEGAFDGFHWRSLIQRAMSQCEWDDAQLDDLDDTDTDFSEPGAAGSDFVTPDLAIPEFATTDLATTDLATTPPNGPDDNFPLRSPAVDPEYSRAGDSSELAGSLSSLRDFNDWSDAVDQLCDRLLDDHDYQLAPLMLDGDPDQIDQFKKTLGVHSDYFTLIANDPSSIEFAAFEASTRDLVRRKPR